MPTKRSTATCRKCGRSFTRSKPTGRRPRYCGVGCKRAAAYERQRLGRQIDSAEAAVVALRRRVALEVEPYEAEFGDDDAYDDVRADLAWWAGEVARLEGRLRDLLDDEEDGRE